MRLRHLHLQNYRCFREETLEFPDGVLAIVGPNGAGKSTLIESIAWCLFGHEAARTGKDLIKRMGAAPGDDVSVRLAFELGGQSLVVTRRLRGKSLQSDAQVEVDGALVVAPGANSAELASSHMARVLGMDRKGFLATVVAIQGDLGALDAAAPQERKRVMLGLLGIDRIDQAIAQCRAEKREALIRLEEVRRALHAEGPLRGRVEAAERDLGQARIELVAARSDAGQRTTRLGQLREETDALDESRQRHRDLRARLDGQQRALASEEERRNRVGIELNALTLREAGLTRLRSEAPRWAELDQKWERFEDERRALGERRVVEASHATLSADLARWSQMAAWNGVHPQRLRELDEEVTVQRRGLEEGAARIASLESHVRHLEDERRRLEVESASEADRWRDLRDLGPHAPCPVCGRALEGTLAELEGGAIRDHEQRRLLIERGTSEARRVRLEVEAARSQQLALRAHLEKLEGERHETRRHVDEVRRAGAERDRVAGELQRVAVELQAFPSPSFTPEDAAALSAARRQRDRWQVELARHEAEVAQLPRLRSDLEAARQKALEIRSEIELASRDLRSVAYVDGSFEGAHRQAEEERVRLHEAERRCATLQERERSLSTALEQGRADLAALTTLRTTETRLTAQTQLAEALAGDRGDTGLLPEFREHLVARIRPALARSARALVARMTAGRYTDVFFDAEYGLRVFDGVQDWPLERFSGGERDVVHLAVRLAISELLAQSSRGGRVEFVALDEVLASQDADRRQSVLSALKELGGVIRQVLVVTHLDEVRDRVDHVLRVEPAADGTSRLAASWAA